MNETPKYIKEVQELLANIHENGEGNTPPFDSTPPENEIDMYVEEDRITLIPRRLHGMPVNEQDSIDSVVSDLDTTPLPAKPPIQPASNAAIAVWLFGLLVPLFCIAVQLYFIINPFTVTVTLLAKSQQESLTGTLQLGRVISPLTLSQSQTVPTTGRGHQDAKQATGYITFLNGQFTQVTVPAGTTLTGNSGEQIVTDQDAVIPAASPNPPSLGQVTVSAHATNKGIAGNIPALDINATVSSTLFAKNLSAFSGGQDERDFRAVTKNDITNAAAPLKTTLEQSMQDTLTGQLKSGETLTSPTCTPTTTADHRAGDEATQVKVTVSETCSAVVYNQDTLQAKVTQLLTAQATKKLGTGYSMLDVPQVNVTAARAQENTVVLSFNAQSAWIYALSSAEQQSIKKLIAGRTTEKALQLLTRLPGTERVSLTSSGFGDGSRIPKDISYIHLALYYGL